MKAESGTLALHNTKAMCGISSEHFLSMCSTLSIHPSFTQLSPGAEGHLQRGATAGGGSAGERDHSLRSQSLGAVIH